MILPRSPVQTAQSLPIPARLNAELTLFPNPAKSQINLSYNPSAPEQNVNIVIYDMLGRMAMKKVADFQAGPNVVTMSTGQHAKWKLSAGGTDGEWRSYNPTICDQPVNEYYFRSIT